LQQPKSNKSNKALTNLQSGFFFGKWGREEFVPLPLFAKKRIPDRRLSTDKRYSQEATFKKWRTIPWQ